MVAEAGFSLAVSTKWGVAHGSSDRYSLPRIGPWWRQGRGLVPGLLRSYGQTYV
jgi:hypothetical protein